MSQMKIPAAFMRGGTSNGGRGECLRVRARTRYRPHGDRAARMLARGQAQRALPLTRTLCMAVAARIEGTIVNEAARRTGDSGAELRIGMPSGVMVATASVRNRDVILHP